MMTIGYEIVHQLLFIYSLIYLSCLQVQCSDCMMQNELKFFHRSCPCSMHGEQARNEDIAGVILLLMFPVYMLIYI